MYCQVTEIPKEEIKHYIYIKCINAKPRSANFFLKGQIVNILGFVGHTEYYNQWYVLRRLYLWTLNFEFLIFSYVMKCLSFDLFSSSLKM